LFEETIGTSLVSFFKNNFMETQHKKHASDNDEMQSKNSGNQNDSANSNDAVEEDGTPVLEEEDLEENNIDEDEADDIEWDEPQTK